MDVGCGLIILKKTKIQKVQRMRVSTHNNYKQ
jgi:hypothetical protein